MSPIENSMKLTTSNNWHIRAQDQFFNQNYMCVIQKLFWTNLYVRAHFIGVYTDTNVIYQSVLGKKRPMNHKFDQTPVVFMTTRLINFFYYVTR